MPAHRRDRGEMEADELVAAPGPPSSLLTRLRNFWVFANVMQFIWLFGAAFKIDEDFDIDDFEDECLSPTPHYKLADIGLCLLKAISSQRGLTSADFDEYTRRQYRRRIPDRPNPFGDDEEQPVQRFLDFDTFTQLRVLQQLSMWTLTKPEELRERMKRKETDPQTDWRIEAVGWDRKERTYFLLDDSRLYRRTDPPIPTAHPTPAAPSKKVTPSKPQLKSKPKSRPPLKPARAGTRTSRRLKVSSQTPEPELNGHADTEAEQEPKQEQGEDDETKSKEVSHLETHLSNDNDYELGQGYLWECVAITLHDYQEFLAGIQKSRDANEKLLYKFITDEVMPMLEKAEENRQKKIAKRQRELMSMEKMANAKRSSRIAGKVEREREEAEQAALEEKRAKDLVAARADEERRRKMEEARESRMMTREQRMKEREYKRILHEEELANMSEASKGLDANERKISERRLKAEMAKKQKELEDLQQAEEDWVFDCAGCGVYGENMDDGTPIIACERCSVWQHMSCLGIAEEAASKEDFNFVCADCVRREQEAKQREEDAKKPKIAPLKMKFDPSAESREAPKKTPKTKPPVIYDENGQPIKRKRGRPRKNPLPEDGALPAKRKQPDIEHVPGMPPMKKFKPPKQQSGHEQQKMHQTFMNGPTLSPQGQIDSPSINGYQHGPPPGLQSVFIPFDPVNAGYASPYSQQQPAPQGRSVHETPSRRPPTMNDVGHHPDPPSSSERLNGTPSAASSQGAHINNFPSTPAYRSTQRPNLQPNPSPGPQALSPPDQKKLSPAAAPPAQPGFSPTKPAPLSPQVPAAIASPAIPPPGKSPVMRPPKADHLQGHSPVKHGGSRMIPRPHQGAVDVIGGPTNHVPKPSPMSSHPRSYSRDEEGAQTLAGLKEVIGLVDSSPKQESTLQSAYGAIIPASQSSSNAGHSKSAGTISKSPLAVAVPSGTSGGSMSPPAHLPGPLPAPVPAPSKKQQQHNDEDPHLTLQPQQQASALSSPPPPKQIPPPPTFADWGHVQGAEHTLPQPVQAPTKQLKYQPQPQMPLPAHDLQALAQQAATVAAKGADTSARTNARKGEGGR